MVNAGRKEYTIPTALHCTPLMTGRGGYHKDRSGVFLHEEDSSPLPDDACSLSLPNVSSVSNYSLQRALGSIEDRIGPRQCFLLLFVCCSSRFWHIHHHSVKSRVAGEARESVGGGDVSGSCFAFPQRQFPW